jgi:hypothetical protein
MWQGMGCWRLEFGVWRWEFGVWRLEEGGGRREEVAGIAGSIHINSPVLSFFMFHVAYFLFHVLCCILLVSYFIVHSS